MNIALIVFAGSGKRIKSDIPKQFIKINDIDLVVYTIRKFDENPHVDEIVLVTSESYLPYVESYADKYQLNKIKKVVVGGETRQDSVRLGLSAIECDDDDNILIHDGDRPLVSNAIINQVISELDESEACCPVLEQTERIKEVSNSGRVTLIENKSYDVQTPQGFKFGLIKGKHELFKDKVFSDDISLVEEEVEVKYFPGEKENIKVTEDIDLIYVENALKAEQ